MSGMMPEVSGYKPYVRLIIALVALASIIIALARPWGGIKNQETSREGIEIVIAVDASNSMLASATGEDGGPDRMRTAKLILEKLINRLNNDRVGLIAYAGDAYTLIPVTNDYVSAKTFLNSIDPSMIPYQGTNIGAAVSLAEKSFSERGDVGKAIILLTDAEELENPAGTLDIVKNATKRGIQTDVIGIGSTPVTIPSSSQGRMIDEETGEVVRTALNEDMAIDIAKAGKGIYVNASSPDAIDELEKQLGTLKKAALESSFLVTHDELYFPFVILAIVLLLADFFITDKRNKWLERFSFFSKKTARIHILLFLTSATVISCGHKIEIDDKNSEDNSMSKRDSLLSVYSLEEEQKLIAEGNEYFRTDNTEKADSFYKAALGVNGRSVVANLNRGLNTVKSIMAAELDTPEGQLPDSVMGPMIDSALASFGNAASPKVEKGDVSSHAFYNQGNLYFTQKKYDQAISAYKEALRLNPSDEHARRNLRIAQLQKKDNDQNQNQNQNQEQNQPQQQPQQQPQPDRQQMNEQTSEQILDAAERKENDRRAKMQPARPEKSSGSNKKW